MAEYKYSRELITSENRWNLDDSLKINNNGQKVRLSDEILSSFPSKSFIIKCGENETVIEFSEELTRDEKVILDNIIESNKSYPLAVMDSTPTEAIIKSPNGSKWRITVDDNGILTTEKVE